MGPIAVAAIPSANLALWIVVPPADDGSRSVFARQVFGEAIASTVVLLFAMTLVLATRARFLEPYFGGLDKLYRAHRNAGQVGMLLLIVHVALTPWRLTPGGGVPAGLIAFVGFLILVVLTIGPRLPLLHTVVGISYRSWRHTHKFIGIFFIMGLAHMMLVDSLVVTSSPLFAVLLAAFVVGIASYLYTIFIARFVRPTYRYVVGAVSRLSDTTVEIALRPRKKKKLDFRSGQFVFVKFRHWGLREPHPFTVSSAPTEHLLRLTIKASGDFTDRLLRKIEVGRKATVEGSYGMLDYREGGRQQIWIAGGIGVTPFLSWLRDFNSESERVINFFYSVRTPDDALFWDEIQTVGRQHDNLQVHLNTSAHDGRLTVQEIAALSRGEVRETDIYLCGPVPMIRTFERDLRRAGVPTSSIHFEEFSFR